MRLDDWFWVGSFGRSRFPLTPQEGGDCSAGNSLASCPPQKQCASDRCNVPNKLPAAAARSWDMQQPCTWHWGDAGQGFSGGLLDVVCKTVLCGTFETQILQPLSILSCSYNVRLTQRERGTRHLLPTSTNSHNSDCLLGLRLSPTVAHLAGGLAHSTAHNRLRQVVSVKHVRAQARACSSMHTSEEA